MARSRIIKPEFFQNEELVALPPITRLLFIGLWQLADRDGRLEDRPGKIKLAVLPADDCDVDDMLRQLAEKQLIVRYEVAGTRYLAIPKFLAHQCPHISEKSKGIPPPYPPSAVPTPDKHSASTVLAPDQHRTSLAHSDSDCGSETETEGFAEIIEPDWQELKAFTKAETPQPEDIDAKSVWDALKSPEKLRDAQAVYRWHRWQLSMPRPVLGPERWWQVLVLALGLKITNPKATRAKNPKGVWVSAICKSRFKQARAFVPQAIELLKPIWAAADSQGGQP